MSGVEVEEPPATRMRDPHAAARADMVAPSRATAERPRATRRGSRGGARDARIVLGLMALSLLILGVLAARAEVLFADGLRYIEQARRFERGEWQGGLRDAVDHPLYPLSIALIHRLGGLSDGPLGWQAAAQGASVLSAVLFVAPLFLTARELFGRSAAALGCLLAVIAPLPAHVMADALSESTFLLAWTWGLWAALRYQRAGRLHWLLAAVGLGSIAYLARPEGLLLPIALVASLGVMPLIPRARLDRATWTRAVTAVLVGALVLVGPFVVYKGGIGTKPAVARLLGLAPPSARDAVERERPLEPGRTRLATYVLAVRATFGAIRGSVGLALLPLAAVGLGATFARTRRSRARVWLLLAVIAFGSLAALVRLHATGGYCTPRHALLLAMPLLLAAGSGVRTFTAFTARRSAWLRRPHALATLQIGLVTGLVLMGLPGLAEPVNAGQRAYRQAGNWLHDHVATADRVVDVTGWSAFYGEREAYTFANLGSAHSDPRARWVVVRDAHLAGPWGYCRALRDLVKHARKVARFPERSVAGSTRVTIYDRGPTTAVPP